MAMLHYRISPDDEGDSYWVYASSEEEARQLVAMYAEPDTTDEHLYRCEPDDTHTPAPGIVVSSTGHTFSDRIEQS